MKNPMLSAEIEEILIEKDLYYEDIKMIGVSIKYPKIVNCGDRAAVRINAYYERVAELFLKYCEKKLYKMAVGEFEYSVANSYPFREFSAVLTYETPYNKNSALSIFCDRYEYTGGAHGMTVRSSDTWDLGYGYPMQLKEFYPKGANYKKSLIASAILEAERQIKDGSGMYFEDYKKLIARYFDPEDYYLTEKGLAVFYQLYAIAPYAQGFPVFIAPYSENGPMEPSAAAN